MAHESLSLCIAKAIKARPDSSKGMVMGFERLTLSGDKHKSTVTFTAVTGIRGTIDYFIGDPGHDPSWSGSVLGTGAVTQRHIVFIA